MPDIMHAFCDTEDERVDFQSGWWLLGQEYIGTVLLAVRMCIMIFG